MGKKERRPVRAVRNGLNPVSAQLQRAAEMGRRQELQAQNQSASITRLLAAMQGGEEEAAAHATEIGILNSTLAHTQYRLELALERISELEHIVDPVNWVAPTLPGATVPGGTEND